MSNEQAAEKVEMLSQLKAKMRSLDTLLLDATQKATQQMKSMVGVVSVRVAGQSLRMTQRPAAFLSTRVLPVDAYKVRNSLFLP